MHQIEAGKQQISDFERLATNYKSLEHILMQDNAVQRKLQYCEISGLSQRVTIVGLRAIFLAYL